VLGHPVTKLLRGAAPRAVKGAPYGFWLPRCAALAVPQKSCCATSLTLGSCYPRSPRGRGAAAAAPQ
jgi:hypothetical protein